MCFQSSFTTAETNRPDCRTLSLSKVNYHCHNWQLCTTITPVTTPNLDLYGSHRTSTQDYITIKTMWYEVHILDDQAIALLLKHSLNQEHINNPITTIIAWVSPPESKFPRYSEIWSIFCIYQYKWRVLLRHINAVLYDQHHYHCEADW